MIASDSLVNEFVIRRSSNGILIADSNGMLVQVNPAAAALLDQPADRLIGISIQQTFANNPALLNLFTRSDDAVLDVRLPRKRLAEGIAATLADGGRIVLLQDVSEQRELDARREAFIAQMAHDLRNPIAALIGFADLIETV
ncbi:MAG TPA: histidine kinase dimerization/phospho-acceptor domain-containing protein, partial [Phototrophicaceae bacterium]|nr:histidine kinase dimerization/phospho-acceptor domain-containing protein [Phototrophicaceae bacterium]